MDDLATQFKRRKVEPAEEAPAAVPDADAVPVLDETTARKLVSAFQKAISRNQQDRSKYPDEPSK